jgi:radical SAM superfamily enzyme YgiQ (UPF0313 family)
LVDLSLETHLSLRPVRDRGRAVLVFPNTYHLGMSSLAVHAVYGLLNAADVTCERAFWEPGTRDLRSVESATPLAGFDFVLVSTSFEMDWLQLPALLAAGGLPPLRTERDERHPILIAGGPAVTGNPEPLAELVDALVIGELEPIGPEFVHLLAQADSREEVLDALEALPGVYLPDRQAQCSAVRLCAPDLDAFTTASVILTPATEFGNRFLVEVSRGCGRSCDFCLARRIYHPFRARHPEGILAAVDEALPHTRRVGLVGAAISDYPWLEELLEGLRNREASLSVSSIRAESVTPGLLAALAASGQDTVTLAPEAGSDGLRAAIGKPMHESDLARAVELAVAAGLHRFRLYFMVGLPGETAADLQAIGELAGRLKALAPRTAFSATITPFVPKRHTALEAAPFGPANVVSRHLQQATAALRKAGIWDVTGESPRAAEVQELLSRGGRHLGRTLVAAKGSLSAFRRLAEG